MMGGGYYARFGYGLLVAFNFVVAFGGLSLPFAAASVDADAPWAGQVHRFLLVSSGIAALLATVAAAFGVYMLARGRAEFLLALSMAALALPAAVSFGYLWYLRNVAEVTISGPVGLWLAVLTLALVLLAIIEAALAFAARILRAPQSFA